MINIKHLDNPEAELFLCRDGLLFFACPEAANRHQGGGFSVMGAQVGFTHALAKLFPSIH